AYLIEALPDHKEAIEKNTAAYLKELDALDKENKEKIAGIPEAQRYLITPHDAFNYFSRRYNIPVKAPQGISTDTEVANKDIEDTVNFIVDHKIKAIFSESTTDPARMEKLK
ncbi:metal ABC transporter solute-binding protein, Zn/Mn family, partial [Aerococcus urinae]